MKYYSKDDNFCNFNLHYDAFFSFKYFCECMEKLGIKNVELLAGNQNLFIDHNGIADVSEQKKLIKEHGLNVAVISAQNCRFRYQFAVKEKDVIEQTFNYFANCMRLCAEMDCHTMQANTGWGYWNENLELGRQRCIEMFQRLSEVGKKYGVRMACESLRPQESLIGWRAQDIKYIMDKVDSPYFKAMIDFTAMGVAGETIQDWFDIFGPENIIHTHMVDGNPYYHYIWGEGKRHLGRDLECLHKNGYNGMLSQEVTFGAYYLKPFEYDQKNLEVWNEYLK